MIDISSLSHTFVVSLTLGIIFVIIVLMLIYRKIRKETGKQRTTLTVNPLLFRFIQLLLICGILWFVSWAHIYEVLVWHKPFTQTFYTSFRNVLSYMLLSIILIYVEYTFRRYKRFMMPDQSKIPKTMSKATLGTLLGSVQKIESEKEEFRLELWELKRKPRGTIGYMLFAFGAVALFISVLFESTILAFIGLGLTFWGASLTFVKPLKYVKTDIADSTAISSLATIDKIISDLNCEGKAMYLPPRYLKEIRSEKVFIPYKKNATVPSADEVTESKVFLKNPQGMFIVPPGLALVNLFERELKTDFIKVDLRYLQDNLPKLLIENLEIAENFEMNVNRDMVHVKMTGSTFQNFCKEASKLSNVCGSLGCPICSSLAVALTRATGKPVVIEKNDLSTDGKEIEIRYRIVEAK